LEKLSKGERFLVGLDGWLLEVGLELGVLPDSRDDLVTRDKLTEVLLKLIEDLLYSSHLWIILIQIKHPHGKVRRRLLRNRVETEVVILPPAFKITIVFEVVYELWPSDKLQIMGCMVLLVELQVGHDLVDNLFEGELFGGGPSYAYGGFAVLAGDNGAVLEILHKE
jgi:hypothetical protein